MPDLFIDRMSADPGRSPYLGFPACPADPQRTAEDIKEYGSSAKPERTSKVTSEGSVNYASHVCAFEAAMDSVPVSEEEQRYRSTARYQERVKERTGILIQFQGAAERFFRAAETEPFTTEGNARHELDSLGLEARNLACQASAISTMRTLVFALRSGYSANLFPLAHLDWSQIREDKIDRFSSRSEQEHSDYKWDPSGAPGKFARSELRRSGYEGAFKTLRHHWDKILRQNSREILSSLDKDVEILDRVLTKYVRLWYDRMWRDQADYNETKITDYDLKQDVLRFLPPDFSEAVADDMVEDIETEGESEDMGSEGEEEQSVLKAKYGVQDSARVQEVLKVLEKTDAEHRAAEDL